MVITNYQPVGRYGGTKHEKTAHAKSREEEKEVEDEGRELHRHSPEHGHQLGEERVEPQQPQHLHDVEKDEERQEPSIHQVYVHKRFDVLELIWTKSKEQCIIRTVSHKNISLMI